ncbi:hypothetical protein CC80DRAFT_554843 [Byssothecium circinans]|uniref:Uncharacterized protein n=1 Tax=Byssothecium circinans TaxID=147558 RepID=A0A6A5TB43_9PLEO|nr:hypothetical protein CC80DRAFT_554843 [Byssothecium circinans]
MSQADDRYMHYNIRDFPFSSIPEFQNHLNSIYGTSRVTVYGKIYPVVTEEEDHLHNNAVIHLSFEDAKYLGSGGQKWGDVLRRGKSKGSRLFGTQVKLEDSRNGLIHEARCLDTLLDDDNVPDILLDDLLGMYIGQEKQSHPQESANVPVVPVLKIQKSAEEAEKNTSVAPGPQVKNRDKQPRRKRPRGYEETPAITHFKWDSIASFQSFLDREEILMKVHSGKVWKHFGDSGFNTKDWLWNNATFHLTEEDYETWFIGYDTTGNSWSVGGTLPGDEPQCATAEEYNTLDNPGCKCDWVNRPRTMLFDNERKAELSKSSSLLKKSEEEWELQKNIDREKDPKDKGKAPESSVRRSRATRRQPAKLKASADKAPTSSSESRPRNPCEIEASNSSTGNENNKPTEATKNPSGTKSTTTPNADAKSSPIAKASNKDKGKGKEPADSSLTPNSSPAPVSRKSSAGVSSATPSTSTSISISTTTTAIKPATPAKAPETSTPAANPTTANLTAATRRKPRKLEVAVAKESTSATTPAKTATTTTTAKPSTSTPTSTSTTATKAKNPAAAKPAGATTISSGSTGRGAGKTVSTTAAKAVKSKGKGKGKDKGMAGKDDEEEKGQSV